MLLANKRVNNAQSLVLLHDLHFPSRSEISSKKPSLQSGYGHTTTMPTKNGRNKHAETHSYAPFLALYLSRLVPPLTVYSPSSVQPAKNRPSPYPPAKPTSPPHNHAPQQPKARPSSLSSSPSTASFLLSKSNTSAKRPIWWLDGKSVRRRCGRRLKGRSSSRRRRSG